MNLVSESRYTHFPASPSRSYGKHRMFRPSLQDQFLATCTQQVRKIKIHLKNDSVLTGYVKRFDQWSLIVANDQGELLLVFRSALAAIVPQDALHWHDLHSAVRKTDQSAIVSTMPKA